MIIMGKPNKPINFLKKWKKNQDKKRAEKLKIPQATLNELKEFALHSMYNNEAEHRKHVHENNLAVIKYAKLMWDKTLTSGIGIDEFDFQLPCPIQNKDPIAGEIRVSDMFFYKVNFQKSNFIQGILHYEITTMSNLPTLDEIPNRFIKSANISNKNDKNISR
jgi:hypothetical protein